MAHGTKSVRVEGSLRLVLCAAEDLIQSGLGADTYKEEDDGLNGPSFVVAFMGTDKSPVTLIIMRPDLTLEEYKQEIAKIK